MAPVFALRDVQGGHVEGEVEGEHVQLLREGAQDVVDLLFEAGVDVGGYEQGLELICLM